VFGGGEQYFTPAGPGNAGSRRDGRNLLEEARGRGYTLVRSRDELNHLSTWPTLSTQKFFGVFAPGPFCFSSLQPDNHRQPSLAEMVRVAISNLNYHRSGYFLVVEDGLVARAAEENLGQLAVNDVGEADEAIETAIEYAGADALVIVTNSYNLGALGMMSAPLPSDLVSAPATIDALPGAAKTAASPPSWVAGPGGPLLNRAQSAWMRQQYASGGFSTNAPGLLQPQPALRFQTRAPVTGDLAWMVSRGEGSSQLRGFFNNTDVFDLISEQF